MQYNDERIFELATLLLEENKADKYEGSTLRKYIEAYRENPVAITAGDRVITGSMIDRIHKREQPEGSDQTEEEPTRMTVRLSLEAVQAIANYQDKYSHATTNRALNEMLEYYWREREAFFKLRETHVRTKKELDSLRDVLTAFQRLLKTI